MSTTVLRSFKLTRVWPSSGAHHEKNVRTWLTAWTRVRSRAFRFATTTNGRSQARCVVFLGPLSQSGVVAICIRKHPFWKMRDNGANKGLLQEFNRATTYSWSKIIFCLLRVSKFRFQDLSVYLYLAACWLNIIIFVPQRNVVKKTPWEEPLLISIAHV